jgi:hypothetical protein
MFYLNNRWFPYTLPLDHSAHVYRLQTHEFEVASVLALTDIISRPVHRCVVVRTRQQTRCTSIQSATDSSHIPVHTIYGYQVSPAFLGSYRDPSTAYLGS